MFAKSRKDRIVDDARSLARDLGEAITPHVERARDEIGPRLSEAREQLEPRLAEAREQIGPRLSEARKQLEPHLTEARKQLEPRLAEAREQIGPRIAEARDNLQPALDNARDRLNSDVLPAVSKAVDEARTQATEARRRGELAAAALKGEDVQRKGRKGRVLVLLGVAALGAVAVRKLLGSDDSANWQTSYSPNPAPAPTPAPASPSAPMAGSHVADTPIDGGTAAGLSEGGDAAGSTPGETLSDASEEPHPVTTPDAPVEDVAVEDKTEGKAKKKA
jgi:hypothetical protein